MAPGSAPATLDETKRADSIDAALPAKLADEVASKLTAHSAHVVYRDPRQASASALVVEGCIVRADHGDAGKRLVGMNLGASKLSAHIKIYRTGATPHLEDEFDVAVEGVNKAPPIGPVGLVVHGLKERHQTLSADAEKAAELIAKHILAGRYAD